MNSKNPIILIVLISLLVVSCAKTPTPVPSPTNKLPTLPTPTSTRAHPPQAVPTATPTATPEPTPGGGGSGSLIFSYSQAEFSRDFPDLEGARNIFIGDLDQNKIRDIRPLTNGLEGFNYLLDISPDGQHVLVASAADPGDRDDGGFFKANLYLIATNGQQAAPLKIAEGLPTRNDSQFSALFLDSSEVIFLGDGPDGYGIYRAGLDGSNPQSIYLYRYDGEINKPSEILSVSENGVYWTAFIDQVEGGNRHYGKFYLWHTSLDSSDSTRLRPNNKSIYHSYWIFGDDVSVAPDGAMLAWIEKGTPSHPHNYLHLSALTDLDAPQTLEIPSSTIRMRWLPDQSGLMIFDMEGLFYWLIGDDQEWEYIEQSADALETGLMDHQSFMKVFYNRSLGGLSPDGTQLLLGVEDQIKIFNLDQGFSFSIQGFNFQGVNQDINWVP